MAQFISSHSLSLVSYYVICVFGAGDATLEENFKVRARIRAARRLVASLNRPLIVVVFYGTHMPNMTHTKLSEAQTMRAYWDELDAREGKVQPLGGTLDFTLEDGAEINNTSRTCKAIVQDHIAAGDTVHLVMNKGHMPRTVSLLKRHTENQYIPWSTVSHRVLFEACDGDRDPRLANQPLKQWWAYLKNPVAYELAARLVNALRPLP